MLPLLHSISLYSNAQYSYFMLCRTCGTFAVLGSLIFDFILTNYDIGISFMTQQIMLTHTRSNLNDSSKLTEHSIRMLSNQHRSSVLEEGKCHHTALCRIFIHYQHCQNMSWPVLSCKYAVSDHGMYAACLQHQTSIRA